MTKKTDRRQLRTNQLLRQSLFSLMQEKRMDSITVTDIANRADINRGTFYLHYKDVPDMIEQISQEMLGRIQKIFVTMNPRETVGFAAKGEPYPPTELIFEEIQANADFFRAIVGPHGDMSFVRKFRQFIIDLIFSKHVIGTARPESDSVPTDYLVAYMTSANIGLVIHWIESGMKLSPREMAILMTQLMNYGPLITSGITSKPSPLS
ncbi:TetR/AcrR family transcriptional regulator [Paenibacillus sp. JCM 10914]|uniref:TetR/AcrR family transcriptional regulator n=1 Tax=Paenibacillus sp. JCM 10914 TaxID=1236974 RepID=UPI0003CC8FA3|nr:TetR/AcrR family transcriptional regulator [Paenibacillus sp. JCM 10914]GAE06345.1 transcriptional regulator, TetR family [Paenibacillus sp. JCM 10914]